MPLYDLKCLDCEHEEEVSAKISEYKLIRCPICHGETKVVFSKPPGDSTFKARWYPHVGPEPIYVESKKQLAAECKKHGTRSAYLMDS